MIALVKEKPEPGCVALKNVADPSAMPSQIMIAVQAAGVCGSDLHVLHYDIKLNVRPPVIMGHEFCGVVEQVGEGVEGFKPGDRVTSETTFHSCGACRHCRSGSYNLCAEKELIGYVHDGCFARYCVVPAQRVHHLPENISFEEGALCEPLACCVHAAMEQTDIAPDDTVVVAGAGAIGLLCAQVVQACGANAIICGADGDGERFRAAKQLGMAQTVNVMREDAVGIVAAATGGEGADIFLECSGAPAAARTGITLLRRGGRFCQVGLFGRPFEIDFEQVAYKELVISGSIGSRRSSWRTALALLKSGQVSVKPLAGEPLPLEDWEEAFRRFKAREGLKILLRPPRE